MEIRVGLVGFGVIGCGVVGLLQEHSRLIKLRSGVEITLKRIADADLERTRPVAVDPGCLTRDYRDIINDPEIDIVIELVGGTRIARDVVMGALKAGKHVVTANKALLHTYKEELFGLARQHQRELRYEASVAGGIPIIKVLTESLAGDRISAIYGIVNGTTNFILTRMIEDKWAFDAALRKAQELGFAEADPTLDVNGGDATHKLDILATLAFNAHVEARAIYTEGIQALDIDDVLYAKELGYVTKLLAIAKQSGESMGLRVHPTLIPEKCSLASVSNEFNAIMIRSEYLGESLFVGRGAGAKPTATAVVSDLCDLAMRIRGNAEFNPNRYQPFNQYTTRSHLAETSRFYLRISAVDRAGILASIARILSDHDISISALTQKEGHSEDCVPIVILTHQATEGNLRQAVEQIDQLDVVRRKTVVLHVEDLSL